MKLALKAFTPLHPESPVPLQSLFVTGPAFQNGDEGQIKIKSSRKPRHVTKEFCNVARPLVAVRQLSLRGSEATEAILKTGLLRPFGARNDGRWTASLGRGVTGFTLVEILITASILVFCLCGLLLSYINMFLLADLSRDITLVTNAVVAKMEEIKKTSFDSLSSYNGNAFDISGFASSDAKGSIEVTDTAYGDLKRVRLVACFRSRGRVIGEDKNLNGRLNQGEDTLISNNRLDSPAELVTLIAK